MSHEELQRQSLEAALGDVGMAWAQFDDVAGWLPLVPVQESR